MDIRERRIELGYKSANDFAKKNGFSVGSVSMVERNLVFIKNMQPERQKMWARALKCSVDDFKIQEAKLKAPAVFPVKTYHMDKKKLELYLKARFGDKIGAVKPKKINSLLCHEYQQYAADSKWWLDDTRMDAWGY